MIEGKHHTILVKDHNMIVDIERYTEIERENRILLEKMTSIMSQKNKNNLHCKFE